MSIETFSSLWNEAVRIWVAGGWAMIGIALIAVVLFGLGVRIYFRLRAQQFTSVGEDEWRRWIVHPAGREGRIGELLDLVTAERSLAHVADSFEHLRSTELGAVQRDLRLMRICVTASPLVGLLGTVTGMLATFSALASGSSGDQTMGMIADGISVALITTETGLVIALPGLFFQFQLTRKFERYKAFLAHLESLCSQEIFREQRRETLRRAQGIARLEIAELLRKRLQQKRRSGWVATAGLTKEVAQ